MKRYRRLVIFFVLPEPVIQRINALDLAPVLSQARDAKGVIFFLIPISFISYLIYCEIRLYREFAKSLHKGEDDSGYAMGAVGAMGAVKHVATATAVAKPVMATAVAKPVVTATAVAAA